MVRLIHKTKIASAVTLAVATPALTLAGSMAPVQAENVDFNVNVAEVITVSITDPTSWASGELTNYNSTSNHYESDLLRNKVTVSAATNNATGVTVSMYANNTNLINQANNSCSISTLGSDTLASAITANQWGYSTSKAADGETDAGNTSANYHGIPTSSSPATVFTTVGTGTTNSGSESIYFGAKADDSKQSGTYAQTVYFAAVTGTIDTGTNPQVPVNPSEPPVIADVPTYDSGKGVTGGSGQTSYGYVQTTSGSGTSSVSGETKTNKTEVSSGDTRSSYTQAAGVTTTTGSTTSSINSGSSVAIALGVAAGVAAISGGIFFVLAKRRNDDDEED